MDDILNEQFERVEKALTTLVDSIAAYNPATQAAVDLVAADDELSEGLDQLAKHQANHVRIQHLRAEADALEEQLKTSVKKLAELRHELFNTSVTTFPEDSRAVPFDELLQYATNISRYTVPPTYRERIPAADKDKEDEDVGSSGAPTNGLNTPALPPETVETATEAVQGQKEGEDAAGPALEITPEEEEWLKKLKASNLAWYPWPSNEKIRAGALFSLQYWREKGKNLDEFNIPAHLKADRDKVLQEQQQQDVAAQEVATDSPGKLIPQQLPSENTHRPKPLGVFAGFDDDDDD
ncbi:hypothetical protein AA0118_g5208 [Alternaria tenuissima]|uniref:Mediator of RNA polymerase II transcription subunit 4 n=1 Tax=Alternaria tenuissima TaxID=119927 RepID=A0A4Q4MH44_9PLEO|nr:hypothetical protein AA0114_g6381 [Alternaria tenuissima]RYN62727.1 hypothetical protein AA0118_g5208 [Alternaria tenuissima]RYN99137.1 hypothetical protein AA0120_g1821 [Alternaria tenuissima]